MSGHVYTDEERRRILAHEESDADIARDIGISESAVRHMRHKLSRMHLHGVAAVQGAETAYNNEWDRAHPERVNQHDTSSYTRRVRAETHFAPRHNTQWTLEEDEVVMTDPSTAYELSSVLGRSVAAIQRKRAKLGWDKKAMLAERRARRYQRIDEALADLSCDHIHRYTDDERRRVLECDGTDEDLAREFGVTVNAIKCERSLLYRRGYAARLK